MTKDPINEESTNPTFETSQTPKATIRHNTHCSNDSTSCNSRCQPSTLGIEENPTQASRNTWDDDSEDVEDEDFDPENFPEDDSEHEEDVVEEESEDEETAPVHINLKDKNTAENGGKDRREELEFAETEKEDGLEEIGTGLEGEEEVESKHLDGSRSRRSMSPSPQPPPTEK